MSTEKGNVWKMKRETGIHHDPAAGNGFEKKSDQLSCEEMAEIMRKKNRYRELILSGRLILPHQRAAQLLGPDCLYRLYSLSRSASKKRKRR
jgi:hypothetical protein